ncbi:MAG TPA: integrase core domain-containing protein [Mycobacterium sp.]|nr:integrase core domain-containing protein [Mycobacterium sp.]
MAWSAAVLDIRLVHSKPGKPQGRGKIERWNRTVREQFLVEIDTGGQAGIESLAELNRLFTAWCHQQHNRAVHTETGTTPAQRYHAADRTPAPRPDPALLRRAFCGANSAGSPRSEPSRFTVTATRWTPL